MTLEHADVSEQQPAVTIVIPAKNEAENVRPLINEIRAAMDGAFDYELIYVDDGSTDDTAAFMDKYIESTKMNVRYFYKNNGLGKKPLSQQ